MSQYRKDVLTLLNPMANNNTEAMLLNASLGIAGEAGEFVELLKKHLFHGHEYDNQKAIKELGDIRYYLEVAAHALGVTMEEVEHRNIEKLRARYKDKFSTERSVNKDESAE